MSTRTISNAASELVPANLNRKSLAIQNEDTADSVYVKREGNANLTVSSTDHDWLLGPGASLAFNEFMDGARAIQARYTCIASANTPRVAFFESEDIQR